MRRYLILMTIVNILDTISTIWLADKIGWRYESNSFLRWYFQRFGIRLASITKIGGALLLAALLWHFCEQARVRWLPWLWFLGFVFVVAFNIGGIIAIGW